jgi:hypothetical protein
MSWWMRTTTPAAELMQGIELSSSLRDLFALSLQRLCPLRAYESSGTLRFLAHFPEQEKMTSSLADRISPTASTSKQPLMDPEHALVLMRQSLTQKRKRPSASNSEESSSSPQAVSKRPSLETSEFEEGEVTDEEIAQQLAFPRPALTTPVVETPVIRKTSLPFSASLPPKPVSATMAKPARPVSHSPHSSLPLNRMF